MPAKSLILAFASLAWLGQPAMAAESVPYPVRWSPELELESIESVEERLQGDLWPGSDSGFDLYPDGDPSLAKVKARSCNALLRYSEQGYWALGSMNAVPQRYNLALCQAIALLGQARAAKTSYLRDFSLDAGAVDFLPALVNLYPSCEFICYAVAANRDRVALSNFDKVERIEVLRDDLMAIVTAGWRVELKILARGDFSADGLDDLLLFAHGGATEGSYRATDLFVLTRNEPDGILRVINAERRLCPDYRCS